MSSLQPDATRIGSGRRVLNGVIWFVDRYWAIILLVAFWQFWVVARGLNSIVMPHPADVARDLVENTSVYLSPLWVTTWQATLGLLCGMALGMALAIVVWTAPFASAVVTPVALILRSVPVVAMIPVLARLLGFGTLTVVVIIVIITFFPTFVLGSTGLRALPANSDDLFSVLGSSRRDQLRRLALPSAIPNVLVALRLTAPISVAGAIIAQFLMGSAGLGLEFTRARNSLMMERAWGAAILALVLSVIFFTIASRIEQKGKQRWT